MGQSFIFRQHRYVVLNYRKSSGVRSVKGCRGQLKRPKAGKNQKDPEYAISLHLSKLGTEYSRSTLQLSSLSFSPTT